MSTVARSDRARRPSGFTLIEVIGAFFMTIVVLVFIFGIFVENGRQREAASELLRVQTSTSAALDLIAQDLEAAVYLARPESVAPADHPWRFVAERAGALGSTWLRFQTQNVPRGQLGEHATSWVDVVYFLSEEDEPDRYTLWRWRSTRPPSDAQSVQPDAGDPGSARVVEGVADFGVVLLDVGGTSLDEWDSSLGPPETPLPVAAEIQLALFREPRAGESEDDELEIPSQPRKRHVTLPMHRPIDLDALIALATNRDAETECATINECLSLGDDAWYTAEIEGECQGDEELCELLQAPGSTCWEEIARDWPSVAAQADPGCEDLR